MSRKSVPQRPITTEEALQNVQVIGFLHHLAYLNGIRVLTERGEESSQRLCRAFARRHRRGTFVGAFLRDQPTAPVLNVGYEQLGIGQAQP